MNNLPSEPWDDFSEKLLRDIKQCVDIGCHEEAEELEEELWEHYNTSWRYDD